MSDGDHPYVSVVQQLQGTAFSQIRYVAKTASTNADAALLLGDEAAYGTTLVAEYQTAGAGRKGREWVAQAGTSLLFTTILPRTIQTKHLWAVPFGVALAVRRALRVSGIPAEVHWPNDLLAGGNKIAGILATSRVAGDRAWVAAGIGINVYREPGAAEGIEPPPAFASDFNPAADRATLLRDVLLNFEVWHESLDMPPRIARVWERVAGLPGKRYRIAPDDGEPFDATAIALAPGGALVVELADGSRKAIALADARAMR